MDERTKGNLRISDESVREKTGKGWEEWHSILDEWDVKKHGHTLTAKHLSENLGVSPWWAQAITNHYERTRGLK